MKPYEPLPHKIEIAAVVRRMIHAGVSMRVILDHIQQYKDAPKSSQTLYKVYRNDIADARATIQEEIGSVVVNAAKAGDLKAAELFLRSRAGWNPTIKVVEEDADAPTEETGAIDALLTLLNMSKDKPVVGDE